MRFSDLENSLAVIERFTEVFYGQMFSIFFKYKLLPQRVLTYWTGIIEFFQAIKTETERLLRTYTNNILSNNKNLTVVNLSIISEH